MVLLLTDDVVFVMNTGEDIGMFNAVVTPVSI